MVIHPVSVALLRASMMFGTVVNSLLNSLLNSVLNSAIISFYNIIGMLCLVYGPVLGISSALVPMVLPPLLMLMVTLVIFIGYGIDRKCQHGNNCGANNNCSFHVDLQHWVRCMIERGYR